MCPEMLEEAVAVIRLLCRGGVHTTASTTPSSARTYTLPGQLPEIMVAASEPKAVKLAGRIGDGLITTSPNKKVERSGARASRTIGKSPYVGQRTGPARRIPRMRYGQAPLSPGS